MTEPLHLLLLEHSSADVELCLAELERGGFEVRADVVAARPEPDSQSCRGEQLRPTTSTGTGKGILMDSASMGFPGERG